MLVNGSLVPKKLKTNPELLTVQMDTVLLIVLVHSSSIHVKELKIVGMLST